MSDLTALSEPAPHRHIFGKFSNDAWSCVCGFIFDRNGWEYPSTTSLIEQCSCATCTSRRAFLEESSARIRSR